MKQRKEISRISPFSSSVHTQWSHHTTVSNENPVTIFADEKPFWFGDADHRWPMGKTKVANLDLRYPGIQGTAPCSLSLIPLSVN